MPTERRSVSFVLRISNISMSEQFQFRYKQEDGATDHEKEHVAEKENLKDGPSKAHTNRKTSFKDSTSVAAAAEVTVNPSNEEITAAAQGSSKVEKTTKAPSKGTRYPYELKRMVVNYHLEKLCSAAEAARVHNVPVKSAQRWCRLFRETGELEATKEVREPKAVLGDDHRSFVANSVPEESTARVDSLTEQFEGLSIKETAVHKSMTEKCTPRP